MSMKNLGIEKLKKIVGNNNLTQSELALKIGVTQAAISQYFSGKRWKIDPQAAIKIVKAFPQIKIMELFNYVPNNKSKNKN